jgi:hypothetical protein
MKGVSFEFGFNHQKGFKYEWMSKLLRCQNGCCLS